MPYLNKGGVLDLVRGEFGLHGVLCAAADIC